jgi:acyl-CoA synthetase (AMP-forming)/AMP-acid ligase II
MQDHDAIAADRRQLRERWRSAGFYAGKSLSRALAEGARRYPEVESVFYAERQPRRVTNRELYAQGLEVAAALHALGVRRGDVVAVQLPSWLETAALFQGIAQVGAVVLPIVSIYGRAEVEFVLRQSRARAYFAPARWRSTDYLPRCEAFAALPDLERIVLLGDGVPGRFTSWPEFLAGGEPGFEPALADPDDVCLLMYTSGTSSAPKGVRHTHETLLREWGRPTYANRGLYLANLPAGHYTGYGFLMRPSLIGAPMIFLDHWDAVFAAKVVERHHVKHGGGTPIFLFTLLRAAEEHAHDLSSLESFSMGGQGMTPAMVEQADRRGFPGARVYGSTEHPTVTAFDPTLPFERRAFTDGRIDEGNEVRIVDDASRDLPFGAEGEILTRGPEMFVGYLDPALDRESFLPGGWFKTGDVGRLDRDGFLTVTDRKKDLIIRGGENISSVEVEEVLLRHPAVAAAAAVAMPDPTYGEKVCAFVELTPGSALTLAEVGEHFARAGVARQKTPERLEVLAQLPRNASGKVRKFELRAQLREAARCAEPGGPSGGLLGGLP